MFELLVTIIVLYLLYKALVRPIIVRLWDSYGHCLTKLFTKKK